MLHYAHAVSNITTVVFDADDSLQSIMFREHVQLVKVDASDDARVDGTLSMLNMSRIHNSKYVRGRWLPALTSCVSSDKSAMPS